MLKIIKRWTWNFSVQLLNGPKKFSTIISYITISDLHRTARQDITCATYIRTISVSVCGVNSARKKMTVSYYKNSFLAISEARKLLRYLQMSSCLRTKFEKKYFHHIKSNPLNFLYEKLLSYVVKTFQ